MNFKDGHEFERRPQLARSIQRSWASRAEPGNAITGFPLGRFERIAVRSRECSARNPTLLLGGEALVLETKGAVFTAVDDDSLRVRGVVERAEDMAAHNCRWTLEVC
jgi:hypothetical protein